MTIKIKGELELDLNRGVIWFNSNKGQCVLRICRLPCVYAEWNTAGGKNISMIDITGVQKVSIEDEEGFRFYAEGKKV